MGASRHEPTDCDCVDWRLSNRVYPGQPRFTTIKTIPKVDDRTKHPDRTAFNTRFDFSSAAPDINRLVIAGRSHWGVECMNWLLDVTFKDNLSRYRSGYGAKNMAASWDPKFPLQILRIK